jgi:TolB-like protein
VREALAVFEVLPATEAVQSATLATVIAPRPGVQAPGTHAAPMPRPRRNLWLAGGTVAAILVVIAVLSVRTGPTKVDPIRWIPRSTAPAEHDRPGTIAVMEFENLRADDTKNNCYCKMMQSGFNTLLDKIPQLPVFAPEIIQRTAKEGGLDSMTAARQLGVNRFIAGSFAVMGNTLSMYARIVETEQGWQEAAESVEGDQEQFFDLQKQLAFKILDRLRVHLTEAQRTAIDKPTNTRLDKYRMLLGAEGVTEHVDAPAATPVGPQAGRSNDAWSWLTLPWLDAVYAQAPPHSPEAAVREVLNEYRRAHESGNLDDLASLYVSFPASQREALSAYLKGVKQLKVELVDVKIQPRDHDVAVSYTRRDNFIDQDTGEPVTLEVRVTKFMVQDGGKWKFAEGG